MSLGPDPPIAPNPLGLPGSNSQVSGVGGPPSKVAPSSPCASRGGASIPASTAGCIAPSKETDDASTTLAPPPPVPALAPPVDPPALDPAAPDVDPAAPPA